jgi:hypothetical protein
VGLRIDVKSVLPDPPGPVDAPPGPLERPFDWGWFLLVTGAVLTALAAAALFVRWLRRRPVFAPPPPPPIPPWDRALARLEALRGRAVNTEAEVQAYYVEVSSIVRDYLEDRFRVRAPEMTTEEFLAAAATEQHLTEAHRLLLSQFLLHCDLVKFAHGRSTALDRAGLIASAERFVQETRVAAEDLTRSTEASAGEKVRA